jgi:AraC-like DNA-binding protein
MSELSFLSESAFSKKFKAETGTNFSEYLIMLRISKAEKLLVSSNFSVTKISGMCGFQSSSYFTLMFKKYKGITPKKYRMKYIQM